MTSRNGRANGTSTPTGPVREWVTFDDPRDEGGQDVGEEHER